MELNQSTTHGLNHITHKDQFYEGIRKLLENISVVQYKQVHAIYCIDKGTCNYYNHEKCLVMTLYSVHEIVPPHYSCNKYGQLYVNKQLKFQIIDNYKAVNAGIYLLSTRVVVVYQFHSIPRYEN